MLNPDNPYTLQEERARVMESGGSREAERGIKKKPCGGWITHPHEKGRKKQAGHDRYDKASRDQICMTDTADSRACQLWFPTKPLAAASSSAVGIAASRTQKIKVLAKCIQMRHDMWLGVTSGILSAPMISRDQRPCPRRRQPPRLYRPSRWRSYRHCQDSSSSAGRQAGRHQ